MVLNGTGGRFVCGLAFVVAVAVPSVASSQDAAGAPDSILQHLLLSGLPLATAAAVIWAVVRLIRGPKPGTHGVYRAGQDRGTLTPRDRLSLILGKVLLALLFLFAIRSCARGLEIVDEGGQYYILAALSWFVLSATGFYMCSLGLKAIRMVRQGRRDEIAHSAAVVPGLAVAAVSETDVSTVAFLRKRFAYAATSLKIIGVLSAIFMFAWLFAGVVEPISSTGATRLLVVALIGALLTLGCAFQTAKRLRSGSTRAFALAAAWWVLWAGFLVFYATPKSHLDVRDLIGAAIMGVPTYFLAQGLFAFVAYRAHQSSDRNSSDTLAPILWEEALPIKKRPKFLNKTSITAYVFIVLSLLVLLISVLMYFTPPGGPDEPDQAWLMGYIVGRIPMFLIVLWISTVIYRRARRAAMLPGSALVRKDVRSIVLYLRSFHDDTGIMLRARANNGRILLEKIVKISFEEVVTDHMWGYGPVLAIGNPQTKNKPAPLGAARDYMTDSSWREKVTELMQRASMIVAIAGGTQGLAWEIDTIVRLGLVSKFVLLLPPVDMQELEARWQYLASNATSAVLPSEIDLVRARAVIFPNGNAALISGDKRDDWTYEAVLDEAAMMILNKMATLRPPSL